MRAGGIGGLILMILKNFMRIMQEGSSPLIDVEGRNDDGHGGVVEKKL